jgi:hypothetical protein
MNKDIREQKHQIGLLIIENNPEHKCIIELLLLIDRRPSNGFDCYC